MSDDDTYAEFSDAVNMTAKQLEKLAGHRRVQGGRPEEGRRGESTGHEMGRRIVTLLEHQEG